jgi:hypothetical protein
MLKKTICLIDFASTYSLAKRKGHSAKSRSENPFRLALSAMRYALSRTLRPDLFEQPARKLLSSLLATGVAIRDTYFAHNCCSRCV